MLRTSSVSCYYGSLGQAEKKVLETATAGFQLHLSIPEWGRREASQSELATVGNLSSQDYIIKEVCM